MSIEKDIETNNIMLRLLDELDKYFQKQSINIAEHSFGLLKQKIVEDTMKLEMKAAPVEDVVNSMSEMEIIEKLKRNPQLLDIVQTFKEDMG